MRILVGFELEASVPWNFEGGWVWRWWFSSSSGGNFRTAQHPGCGMGTADCFLFGLQWESGEKAKQKDLKTCTLPRKEACVKLGPRKALLPKRLCPLKRSQVLCIRTVGKIPWRHPRNWPNATHFRLKDVKVLTHLKDCFEKRAPGCPAVAQAT
jgi:hypothetical protein